MVKSLCAILNVCKSGSSYQGCKAHHFCVVYSLVDGVRAQNNVLCCCIFVVLAQQCVEICVCISIPSGHNTLQKLPVVMWIMAFLQLCILLSPLYCFFGLKEAPFHLTYRNLIPFLLCKAMQLIGLQQTELISEGSRAIIVTFVVG